eukprot:NODE_4052_length_499_cov_1110.588889_g3458_i0.p1 GENE.NODE_4052_length_499_cov_1110.588889_g3458_i0~~NODE_4052_length_499_cov_1110.588889_g3458_i0.p1  ORF type:complete len:135 (-),score=24.09 NODE_4052_length_499_cov_1110.588889_g3458_i0:57-461(-)
MVKFLKPGKVILMLSGAHAGKKAVIIHNSDSGNKERPYAHCVVAGVKQYPKKITKRMGRRKMIKRSRILPFLKVVNHKHVMPTRYNIYLGTDWKGKISISDPTKKKASRKTVRTVFQQRYYAGKNKWFFSPLRF